MKPILGYAALFVGAVAVGGYFLNSGSTGSTPAAPALGAANAQDASAIDTSSIVEMTLGQADAPVTVIEYASYTCPHCATFHEGPFKQLKEEYIDTGKVQFIYREVYFDRFGLWASMVARCGGESRFFGVSEMIYDQQSEWSRGEPAEIADNLRRIGRAAGMNDDELDACLNDGDKAQALVAWYQGNAEEHNINSTPSFVVNGTTYSNMNYADFSSLIDDEIGS
ncbi:MAG: DsbA family protein [Pseudomonadota bacterium]